MCIETERLCIRPFQPSDAQAVITLMADPGFMKWSLDGVLSPGQARAKLKRFIDLQKTHQFSKWAVSAKDDRGLIGYCGFGLIPIDGKLEPELGYRLRPDVHGKGLATEAAKAVVGDAFIRLKMQFVQAIVDPNNNGSLRVLDKLGMIYQRQIIEYEREWPLYRLERSAWEQSSSRER